MDEITITKRNNKGRSPLIDGIEFRLNSTKEPFIITEKSANYDISQINCISLKTGESRSFDMTYIFGISKDQCETYSTIDKLIQQTYIVERDYKNSLQFN